MTQKSKAQVDKFKEAARELGADEDEAAFDAKLKKVAKLVPEKDDSTKKPA